MGGKYDNGPSTAVVENLQSVFIVIEKVGERYSRVSPPLEEGWPKAGVVRIC